MRERTFLLSEIMAEYTAMEKRISDVYDPADSSQRSAELEYEMQRARDRMRYVDPQTCGKILGHDRYWTRQFLARYLDRCDASICERPDDGYRLARHAPELARRIRVGSNARYFDSERDKASAEVWALAVQGSACRSADEMAEAELVFQRAFALLKRRGVGPKAVAELERRYAAYLAVARDAEADEHLERSLEICRRIGYRAGEADALALRGYVSFHAGRPGAVADFVEAMRLADLQTRRGKDTYNSSLQNLTGTLLLRGKGLREQEAAVVLLQQVKEELKGRSLSARKVKLVWIEGLMLRNLGVDRHAQRQLNKAREGLFSLKQPLDFTLVSLDLGQLLLSGEEVEAVRDLGRDTQEKLTELTDDPTLLEIISLWPRTASSVEDFLELRRDVAAIR